MRKLEIEIPDGKMAKWVNGVLTLVDDEKPQNVMERIKTFEDAVVELSNRAMNGDKYAGKLLDEWKISSQVSSKDLLAYLKLRIITSALNEGWKPKFIPREYRWAPYFLLYTKEEIEKMNAETRARVVLRSAVSFAYANYDSVRASAYIESLLAFKSKELAEYAGKQFTEIYADFILKAEE